MLEGQSTLIRAAEAGRILGLDRRTVRQMCNRGELPKAISIGGRFYLDRKQFFAALKKLQQGSAK